MTVVSAAAERAIRRIAVKFLIFKALKIYLEFVVNFLLEVFTGRIGLKLSAAGVNT